MPRLRKNRAPHAVVTLLRQLGGQLEVARKRRRLSQAELAEKAGVSIPTVRSAERGRLGVSLGAYAALLWAMGLESQLGVALSPANDAEGLALEQRRLPQRARGGRSEALDGDF